MTSYIPSITLPGQVFATPAASILLPVALGTAVGFSIRRRFFASDHIVLFSCESSNEYPGHLSSPQAATLPPSASVVWSNVDGLVWLDGIFCIPRLDNRHVVA